MKTKELRYGQRDRDTQRRRDIQKGRERESVPTFLLHLLVTTTKNVKIA